MNIVPGSSFFQTVAGSAARPGPETARPPQGTAQILQAQAVEPAARGAEPDGDDTPSRAPARPYGPRGSLVDIVA